MRFASSLHSRNRAARTTNPPRARAISAARATRSIFGLGVEMSRARAMLPALAGVNPYQQVLYVRPCAQCKPERRSATDIQFVDVDFRDDRSLYRHYLSFARATL